MTIDQLSYTVECPGNWKCVPGSTEGNTVDMDETIVHFLFSLSKVPQKMLFPPDAVNLMVIKNS